MSVTPEEYQKLKDVFNEAVEMDPSAREGFLRSAADTAMRHEVEKMLAAVDSDALETTAFEHLEIDKTPDQIGSFKIEREIGRGGMGSVYEGTRSTENFTQRAAVKVIRNGMNNATILRRFRSEQKILASLEHPNIARFLDGGTTPDNLPFYAMEFVDGKPIVDHCRENHLSEREIVELFRQVCAAVSYAHSQLVVHRDLKPSNIIVDRSGAPKLLDFGIAKVLETEDTGDGTATQLGMMTPQYASPEQIRGEKVSTASDVYSLGMILHELLYDSPPYVTDKKTYAEIIDLVSADKPVKTPTTQPRRNDDLNRIVSKALHRDLDRRYTSVESLSDDLRRWLHGLPVTARPESVSYRFTRFIQRNRVAAIASALVFLSLITGIVIAAWQAQRAEEQRALAERRFGEVRNLANNVVFKYHDEIAKLDGSTGVREMLVADALTYLDALSGDAAGDAGLQRELALAYLKLGDVQGRLYSANTGNTEGSIASYQKAVGLLESALTIQNNDAAIMGDLVNAYDSLLFGFNRVNVSAETKESLLRRSAELLENLIAAEPGNAQLMIKLAGHYIRAGDIYGNHEDIKGLQRKLAEHLKGLPAVQKLENFLDDDRVRLQTIARMYQRLGTDHMWLGEDARSNGDEAAAKHLFQQGVPFHEKMVAYAERVAAAETNATESRRIRIAAYSSFAELLAGTDRKAEALEFAERAMRLAREGKAADPGNREADMDIANIHDILGKVRHRSGDDPGAIREHDSAANLFRRVIEQDANNAEAHTRLLQTLRKLARLSFDEGDPRQATAYQQEIEARRSR